MGYGEVPVHTGGTGGRPLCSVESVCLVARMNGLGSLLAAGADIGLLWACSG